MSTWYPYTICYRCSIVTESVSPAVCEILSPKHIGSQHTLRHWSRDDSIPHTLFPIGAPLKPSPYLQALANYSIPNISGSRPWPFGVTWRHRACDHLIPPYSISYRCSIVTDYLQPFSRYRALNILGSRPWPFKVTWRHRSRDDSIPRIGLEWNAYRKCYMGHQMVSWPMTSPDPKSSRSWPQYVQGPISRKRLEIESVTIKHL